MMDFPPPPDGVLSPAQWHFERDAIPYALETDWPLVDPVEIELVSPGKSSR
jgi:hypothetical protein